MVHGLYLPATAMRWLLRRLPCALLARLDAWSQREAQRRADRRRQAQPARR